MDKFKTILTRSFVDAHNVFVCSIDGQDVILASSGAKLSAIEEVLRTLGTQLTVKYVSKNDFDEHKANFFHSKSENTLTKGLTDEINLFDAANELESNASDVSFSEENSEIIDFVNAIFSQAFKRKANDIAIETTEKELVVRFVINGDYREVTRVSRRAANAIIARIKIMAKLDTIAKKTPQDAGLTLHFLEKPFDLRVSTIPTVYGERISIRILPNGDSVRSLDELGLSESERKSFEFLISRPQGVLMFSGPTGSGKTSTMYSAIDHLSSPSKSIITIENPIEIRFDRAGITQTEVSSGYGFANGLRTILRQFPNVILIGEIRDNETADIALKSADSGHITIASIHSHSSAATISRLKGMGVESHYLSSSLQGVISMRLLKKLCPSCKEPRPVSKSLSTASKGILNMGGTHYSAKGCPECEHTGFIGRSPIFEILVVNDTIRQLMNTGASDLTIAKAAFDEDGTLLSKAYKLVAKGETSIEELMSKVHVPEGQGV